MPKEEDPKEACNASGNEVLIGVRAKVATKRKCEEKETKHQQ